MKIAQVVCVYPPYKGGIGTSALETARVLSLAGHEVKTFTIKGGEKKSPLSRGVDRAARDGVCFGGGESKVISLKAFPGIGNGGFLPQLFWRLHNFDLIYLHYPFFGAAEIVWLLKKFVWHNKTKLAVHFHMEPEFTSLLSKILSQPLRLIAPSLFKQADLIVCASRDYAEVNMLPKIWAANQAKIVEIPFSVDTERFKPIKFVIPTEPELARASGGIAFGHAENLKGSLDSAGASLGMTKGINKKTFRILFVGGLDKAHYFKGIDILLDALSLLDKDRENWQMEIVGGGDLQTQYENRARELGLSDKVIFSGRAADEELPKKYQAADCFVLPSINKGEAFGIVLLEAMASGLPVIASNLTGVRKVFTDGQEGLLVRPGNAYDLKEKLEFLMENPARRKEMGERARKLVEEKYSREKINAKLISVLVD